MNGSLFKSHSNFLNLSLMKYSVNGVALVRFVEIIEAKVFHSDSSLICYCTLYCIMSFVFYFLNLDFLK